MPGAAGGRKDPPLEPLQGAQPCWHLTLDFWLQDGERTPFCCLRPGWRCCAMGPGHAQPAPPALRPPPSNSERFQLPPSSSLPSVTEVGMGPVFPAPGSRDFRGSPALIVLILRLPSVSCWPSLFLAFSSNLLLNTPPTVVIFIVLIFLTCRYEF